MDLRKISARRRELAGIVKHLGEDLRSNPIRYEAIYESPQAEFARFVAGESAEVGLPLEWWPAYCADSAMAQLLNGAPEAGQSIVRAIAWRALCYQEFETRLEKITWRVPSETLLAQTLMHAMVLGWGVLTERLGELALKLGERALALRDVPDPHHRNPPFCEIHDGAAFPIACCLFQKASGRESAYRARENLPVEYRPLIETIDKPDAKAFADAISLAAAHRLAMSVPYDGDDVGVVRDYVMALDAFFPVEIFAAMMMRRDKGLEVEPLSDPWLAEAHAFFTSLPAFEPDPLYAQVVERLVQTGFAYTAPAETEVSRRAR